MTRQREDLPFSPATGMLGAADPSTPVCAQMPFEIAAPHAAATNRRCSRSPSECRPACSSSGVKTVRSASSALSRAPLTRATLAERTRNLEHLRDDPAVLVGLVKADWELDLA